MFLSSIRLSLDIHARSYAEGDDEKIVTMLRAVFNRWPRHDLDVTPLDHWRWKYSNKYLKEKLITVAEKDDRVIGCLHSIPMKTKMHDYSFRGLLGGDAAVHADYRRRGVRNLMSKHIAQNRVDAGIDFVFTVTSNPVVVEMLSKDREQLPFKVINMTRIRDIDLQLRAMPVPNPNIIRLGFTTLKTVNLVKTLVRGGKENIDLEPQTSGEDFLSLVEPFWEKVKSGYEFIVERDSSFIDWRYLDKRGGNFYVTYLSEDSELLGYLVSTVNKVNPDYPLGYIVDMMALPDRLDVANALVEDAMRGFDRMDVNIINVLAVKGAPYERVFSRHGFLDSRVQVHIFHTEYNDKESLVESFNNLNPLKCHFSYGDIDSLPASIPEAR